MQSMQLLLSDARGVYIPRDFVEGFDLSKFDGISPNDIETCKNPENEGYWDAWNDIIDSATFTENGHTFRLHQDGDLWAICPELMTNDEYQNFFGEMKPAPDDAYEYEVCSDCLIAEANDDYTGMDDETEFKVRDGLSALRNEYSRVIVDGAEYGFKHYRCECCGALPGDRFRILCFKD